jgi:photosystem I P700 chlorophyll a apoprotein A2
MRRAVRTGVRTSWGLLAALCALAPAGAAFAQDAGASAPRGKVLPLQGKVLDIVGVTLGLEATLRDLGAKVTAQEIRIELAADVLFDFDSAKLRPEAQESLRKLASVVAANPGRPVEIEGHTDSHGADAYNQQLSEQRAASVKDWLVAQGGIEPARIHTRGLGETRPKAPNARPDGSDDPDGRQQNRRVEIAIRTG